MNTINETSETELIVKTLLKTWSLQITRINDLLTSIGDEAMLKEIAPGKNTGIYLLGHLVAVHDALFPLLGFGNKLYPEREKPFLAEPDKSGFQFPSMEELKQNWHTVNDQLDKKFNQLDPKAWLTKHEAVSAEDFIKEPHRNKLNVLISRTTHMSYHHGQLILLRENSK